MAARRRNGVAQSRRGPEFADPHEVADFAANLEDNWLFCRTYQHNWKPWSAHWSGELSCYEVKIRCNRCTTKRVQRMSDKGQVLASHYEYPDGYLHEGMGRIAGEARDMLRLESVTRVINRQDEQAEKRRNRRKAA